MDNCHTDKQIEFTGGHEMDELCAIEHLNDRWPAIAERFDLPSIMHLNSSKHEHWSTYYTDEQRKLMEEIFAEDIELYNKALNWEKENG